MGQRNISNFLHEKVSIDFEVKSQKIFRKISQASKIISIQYRTPPYELDKIYFIYMSI
jgi:hypothetical protein